MEEGALFLAKARRLLRLMMTSLYMGGASDRRYNLSFIVQNSVDIGKPIIGLSMAYRLSAWGFLDGQEVRDEGSTNVGLHDQR
jgi:carboxylesterase type B